MRRLALAAALFALAACATASPVVIRDLDPCTASALAALEPAPVRPALTPAQQQAYDVAVLRALGEPLAVALIGYQDAALPSWAHRQVERVRAQKTWCEARVTPPEP